MALTKTELKYLASLHSKKGRKQDDRFLAEGVRLLEEALRADYMPLSVMHAPSEINPRGEQLVKDFIARKVPVQSISARECARLSDTKTSQGIVALFDYKKYSLEQQLDKGYRRILICDRIGDPGNMGALVRAAVAFHFDLVITTPGSAETINPKTVRATMGGFFKIPIVDGAHESEIVDQLKKHDYTIYEADARGEEINLSPELAAKAALVIGSEATGTSRAMAAASHHKIRIPMSQKIESLNSAMAGTILMFWINALERKQG